MEEINEERDEYGKKHLMDRNCRKKEFSESKINFESGVFHKGEHKKCFAYMGQAVIKTDM